MSESPNTKGKFNRYENINYDSNNGTNNSNKEESEKPIGTKKLKNKRQLAKRISKQAAKQFIDCNTMFPNINDFNLSNDPKSLYMILKSKLHEKNYIIKEQTFPSFFFQYNNIWFSSCNEIKVDIVKKCKERYFGK